MITNQKCNPKIACTQRWSPKTAPTILWQILICLICVLSISGCLVETPTTVFTSVPTLKDPTPSATFAYPTIPPTATRTAEPSSTPLPSLLDGVGDVLFEDDFRFDRGWDLSQQEQGAISLSNERLVIAIRKSQFFLFSLAPVLSLSDFFLEVDVRAELCQSGDEFGVVFRVNESLEHYRFSLNCRGESRLVRVLSGESRSLILPSAFPFIRSGPMSTNRLSLKATGDTFQFWINGFEVFSSRDIRLVEGAVGLFARSNQGNQSTISFDNFILREVLHTATPEATGTSQENNG